MQASDIEALKSSFLAQGLLFEEGYDEPGKVYTPHRHGWTKLVTLEGSIQLKLDDKPWVEQHMGDICEIRPGQLHEAVVGPEGWTWLAAWRPEEDDTFTIHS